MQASRQFEVRSQLLSPTRWSWQGLHKLILIGIFLLLQNACYVTRAALHHNDLFNSRKPVAQVLAAPQTPPALRQGLVDMQQVIDFAKKNGLETDGAYTYYIQTERPYVSYLVQAAEVDQLKFVTWWFPVVGSVPYLGYFTVEERDDKAQELKQEGYDVTKGAAGAFSSLGWFEDPVFTSMISRSEADIASLFFHELTHRTLWVPGSVAFNENLAEYVSGVLTVDYLQSKNKSEELMRYHAKRADRALFQTWLKQLRAELESLYRNQEGLPRPELLHKKQELFNRYQHSKKPDFRLVDYVASEVWNNASVLGASLYTPDIERFAKAHRCVIDRSIRGFLSALSDSLDKHSDDPFQALDTLCAIN